MITIFNRKQLYTTVNLADKAATMNALENNGIPFRVVCHNLIAGSGLSTRRSVGSIGVNYDYAYEYVFYVKKADYEKARALIQ